MINPEFKKLLDELLKIHDMKNTDYAAENDPYKNFKSCKEFGGDPVQGIMFRMSDKWSRICNLHRKGTAAVKDESIEDTLKDLANYCLLYILVRREQNKYKSKDGWTALGQPDGTIKPNCGECFNLTSETANDKPFSFNKLPDDICEA